MAEVRNLLELSPQEVKEGVQSGTITEEEANTYITRKELAERGLMGMSPESVKHGYKQGIISENDADAYVDRHESPISYYVKDIGKAIVGGATKAAVETGETLYDFSKWATPQAAGWNLIQKASEQFGKPDPEQEAAATEESLAQKSGDELTDMLWEQVKDHAPGVADVADNVTKTYSTPGKIVEPFAQFLAPFGFLGKASKGLKAGRIAKKLLTTHSMSKLAQKSPKMAKFAARVGEDTLKGAVVDYAAFDPYESGMVDMLAENTELQSPVIEFLKTDPDNPAAVERLKQTLEGAAAGVAFDTLFTGLKRLKKGLWTEFGNNEWAVHKEINKNIADKIGIRVEHPLDTDGVQGKARAKLEEQADAAKATADEGSQADASVKDTEGSVRAGEEGSTQSTEKDEFSFEDGAENRVDGEEAADGSVTGEPPKKAIKTSQEDLTQTTTEIFRRIEAGEDTKDLASDDLLTKLEVDGASETILKTIRSHRADEIHKARGSGPVPLKTTEKRAARELGKLTGKKTEDAMDAMRTLFGELKGMSTKVRTLNKFFLTYTSAISKELQNLDSMSFEDELRMFGHLEQLQELQSIVYGVRAEVGRTLNTFNLPWTKHDGRFDLQKLDALDRDELAKQGRAEAQRVLRAFQKELDPAKKMNIARSVGHHGFGEGLLEFVQANLLWNPATQITNLVGGSLAMVNNAMKRYVALRGHSLKTGNPEVMKEWEAYKHGLKMGIVDALRVNTKSFKENGLTKQGVKDAFSREHGAGRVYEALFTGQPILDPMVKVEGQRISSALDKWNKQPLGFRLPIGTLVKIPFHGLTAGDEFMKSIGYFSELHAQTARSAIDRGMGGKDMEKYVKHMLEQPSRELHYKALAQAREITFTEHLGKAGRSVDTALNTRGGVFVKAAFMPFYKVALNLTKYSARNSPLGVMSKKNIDAIKAGGRDKYEAITGMVQGTGLMLGAWWMYDEGKLTGRIPSELKELYDALGIQEYSVKIADKWVSLGRVDPAAFLIGFGADLGRLWDTYQAYSAAEEAGEIDEKFEELMTATVATIAEPVLSKTLLEGLSETLGVIMSPERHNVENYLVNTQASKLIPGTTAFNHWQRLSDDLVREKEGLEGMIRSRFNSESLPARRHPYYGTKVEKDDAWPFPHLGTFKTREQEDDPVLNEMMRLGAGKEAPGKHLTIDGVEQKMTPEQYAKFNDYIAEIPVKQMLEQIISSPEYKNNLYAKDKAEVIRNTIQDARDIARDALIAQDRELQQEFLKKFELRAKARAGIIEFRNPEGVIQDFLDLGR